VREATRSRGHVALPELVERHAGAGGSLRARIRSNMLAWACRSARGSGATCSRGHVAPHAREVRHASGCSVARALVQGDIHPLSCRAARVGRATCGGPMGDMHKREGRFWQATGPPRDDVLHEHPRWTRHFTPKHASWLNQIEFRLGLSPVRVPVPVPVPDLSRLVSSRRAREERERRARARARVRTETNPAQLPPGSPSRAAPGALRG
jgi:hypothetical protein